MPQSTLTDKGQTTVPAEVREALKIQPRQRLAWEIQADGSAVVRPQPSALKLFASLKPSKRFPGLKQEKEGTLRAVAKQAAKEGLK
jgi:antitoxin PrlF